jgi:cholesterol oxidase
MDLVTCNEELDKLDRIDVIVIGSGYGAAVCAARLAQTGKRVVVLERGRAFGRHGNQPFPNTPDAIRNNVQIDSELFSRRHRLGLYNFHINRDLDVLVGCGLGGTSLINAGVAIEPDRRVFELPVWPKELQPASPNGPLPLAPYFQRAREVLQPAPYPTTRDVPRKLATMLSQGGRRCDLNVHFEDGRNSVGVEQSACVDCGDCLTGCNFNAKKTLCFTYLPIARSFGAKIFVQCDVSHIEPSGDGRWTVVFQRLTNGDEEPAYRSRLTATAVVVGAGVLGTTGILLRSKERGLALSKELGCRLSGNGDAFGIAYNCDQRLDSVGYGNRIPLVPPFARPPGVGPAGPAVLGIIDRRDTDALGDGIIIEDGNFPGGTARLTRVLLQAIAGITGSETQHGFTHWFHERLAEGRDLLGDDRDGALNRSMTLLIMGHDGADGIIELDRDKRPIVRWPELHTRTVFSSEDKLARVIAGRLGGMYVKDPLNTRLLMNNQVTVHPMGGCPMAAHGGDGVVNHAGCVFDDQGRPHPKLYVSDASVIPTSLGVNPLWTISALAERIAEHIAKDLGTTTFVPLATIAGNPSAYHWT